MSFHGNQIIEYKFFEQFARWSIESHIFMPSLKILAEFSEMLLAKQFLLVFLQTNEFPW